MKLTDDEIIDLYKELDAYIDEYLEEKQARKVLLLYRSIMKLFHIELKQNTKQEK